VPKLTKRVCDEAKPRERQYIVWCSELPRFGLRVRESGGRTFICQYRAGGRTRVMTLGAFGPLTPDAARREALRVLGEVERGFDPAAKRDKQREALSVRELAARYSEQHGPKLKARTLAEARRLHERIILPALGRRRVGDVTRQDVSRLHASLSKTPVTGNRVLANVHALFAFAERIGALPEGVNPARAIKRYREESRRRYLSPDELRRLGRVLEESEETGTETPEAVACVRLLLLTGCRKSEVLGARWQDVDVERGILRLHDAKAGPRDVMLNPAALAVLDALPHSSEWILPGRDGRAALVNIGKSWRRIRTRAELADVRLHDLRHTHASVGVSAGATLHVLGGLLGHRQPRTTALYAHISDDPLRQASDAIGARLSAALEGRPDAEVVRLEEATPKRR
jgi:integrase